MSIFSLEVFQADEGDSLLLHYGNRSAPKFLLIDGGPNRNTFLNTTAKRLEELRQIFPDAHGQLQLQIVMVSHIDDDHIEGLLAMTDDLIEKKEDQSAIPYNIRTFWLNSFDDILGNQDEEIFNGLIDQINLAGVDGTFPDIEIKDQYSAAILSSVNQGRKLHHNIAKLGIALNAWNGQKRENGFRPLIARPEHGVRTIKWDQDLKLTILAPDIIRLKSLRSKWDAAIRKKPNLKSLADLAAFSDTSVANLSSIVVLAECEGKRMLLTGDARGDDIFAGVEGAGLYDQNHQLHVDLLKLPHHGSDRNVTTEFFSAFPATHYVASGNGKHGNPELIKTIEKMLEVAHSQDDFILHLTNKTGKKGFTKSVKAFCRKKLERGRMYEVNFREPNKDSIIINLLDPVNY